MVKPKYTINDRVYILHDNVVEKVIIKSIQGHGNSNKNGEFNYAFITYDVSTDGSTTKIIAGLHETKLFKNKKELIKSL